MDRSVAKVERGFNKIEISLSRKCRRFIQIRGQFIRFLRQLTT